jgi:hypothetical protein
MIVAELEMPQRKRLTPIVSRTARLSKDVAAMLDLYAEEQRWSANTAMDIILRRYLEGLGFREKVRKELDLEGSAPREKGEEEDADR